MLQTMNPHKVKALSPQLKIAFTIPLLLSNVIISMYIFEQTMQPHQALSRVLAILEHFLLGTKFN